MNTSPIDYIRSTNDLRYVSDYLGSHFFSPESMRFFNSRLTSNIKTIDDRHGYFITSEESPNSPRRYAIRYYSLDQYTRSTDARLCDTVRFHTITHHDTLPQAKSAMAKL